MSHGWAVLLAVSVCACGADPTPPLLFDLVEGFAEGLIRTETTLIDFGDPTIRVDLLEGWGPRERQAGETSVLNSGGSLAAVRVSIVEPRELILTVRCRPLATALRAPQRLEIVVNGGPVGGFPLRRGFQEYRVSVPGRLWLAGDNRVAFRYPLPHDTVEDTETTVFDPTVVWDYLLLEEPQEISPKPIAEARSIAEPRPLGTAPGQGSLLLPLRTQFDYYFKVPEETLLWIPEVRPWGDTMPGDRLEIRFDADDAESRVEELLHPYSDSSVSYSLPYPSGTIARISLRGLAGSRSSTREAGFELMQPTLRSVAVPTEPSSIPKTTPYTEPPVAPAIIIYLIDTLRADHLGTYGYGLPTSPNIDAFARDGVVFERAHAHSSWTKTTVASLLTGQHPRQHAVLDRADLLPSTTETLAELLGDTGYQTAAFVTITTVSGAFGFAQGFDTYANMMEVDTVDVHQLSDRVNRAAWSWLKEQRRPGQPFFLYLHVSDPHTPYTPHSPFRERFAPGISLDDEASFRVNLRGWEPRSMDHLERFRDSSRALYDAEIGFMDAQFGELIEFLKNERLYDSSMIVVLSDHGEEFNEHGGWTHGRSLYEEVLRIPLIIKFPGGWGAGRRIEAAVQQIDVLPTVLAAVGAEPHEASRGVDLMSLISGESISEPEALLSAMLQLGDRNLESLVSGRYKLIVDRAGAPRPRYELYDLQDDPDEVIDLGRERPVSLGYMLSLLRRAELEYPAGEKSPQLQIDPDLERRLRALGYIE